MKHQPISCFPDPYIPPVDDTAPLPLGNLTEQALALAGIGTWQCRIADDMLTWNRNVFDMFGMSDERRPDRRESLALYTEESREQLERLRSRAIEKGEGFTLDVRIKPAGGAPRWMKIVAGVATENGRPSYLYGTKQDISRERERWEDMRRLAENDPLTGVCNRRLFQTRFLDASGAVGAYRPLGALLVIDLDGFKAINDRFGHAAGDVCLEVIARRLSNSFPDALMISRVGGDEFAVLLRSGPKLARLARHLSQALASLSAAIPWQGELLSVSACAGVAMAANPISYDAEALYATADAALYRAKASGKRQYRIVARDANPKGSVAR